MRPMVFIQVALRTSRDRIRAFNALKGESVIGRPVRNLVLSIRQLKKIKDAGISVYPASVNGKTNSRKKIDLDSVIKQLPD